MRCLNKLYCRQLLGQNLSGLEVEELKNLENHLEMSLHNIRQKKVISASRCGDQAPDECSWHLSSQDNLIINQIQELKKKVSWSI